MFLIVIRKMLNNKWMTFCVITGSIITVAMFSSIPIFTNGVMQHTLTKELEQFQESSNIFPGGYLIEYDNTYSLSNASDQNGLKLLDQKINAEMSKSINLPLITQCRYLNAGTYEYDTESTNMIDLVALSGVSNHLKIIHGKIYSNLTTDGVYEVIASENAMKTLNLILGNTYELSDLDVFKPDDETRKFRVKVVGVFTYQTNRDPYWFRDIDQYDFSLLMDPNLLMDTFFTKEKIGIKSVKWFLAYDYHQISIANMPRILKAMAAHEKWFKEYSDSKNDFYKIIICSFPVSNILDQYNTKEKELKIILLVFQIPVLILLAFYSFMLSKLKIDSESNEIAIIKSRGGSGWLVFSIYLAESLIIGGIALLFGPLLGFLICNILGSSNGFLEFVQRSALPFSLKPLIYYYSLMVIGFISISMLIPAIKASRTSIVLFKQKKARRNTITWERYFLDLVLLALSFYGLFNYQRQQQVFSLSGFESTVLTFDPLLFIISTTFIFGSGLLFLRIYPHLIRLVFWLGKKRWNPVFYATFIQVGRTSGQEQFVMLFIILTLSIGIFSANSARTVNQNIEDKIRYYIGADIVVKGDWNSNQPPDWFKSRMLPNEKIYLPQETIYSEPDFGPFTKLSGVASATKVIREPYASVNIGADYLDNVCLLGIIPSEFGKTAWFRNDLLPHHWYQYLNLMNSFPKAVLVSKAFKNLGLKEGDWISFSWGSQSPINAVIYAFIDYWPNTNPPYFIVANLDYIFYNYPVKPYLVWLKKKTGASSNQVYQDLVKKRINLSLREDATEQIIKRKNDPMLQGMNGTLTLNFIVAIMVSIIGFLIFWILSIKKRVLQFGIFRAIGLTVSKITGMLVYEQLLITGAAILAGISIGNLTSRIFVPMLQTIYNIEEKVLPFKTVTFFGDYFRLYILSGLMLISALIVLWRIVSLINISQALKLGED